MDTDKLILATVFVIAFLVVRAQRSRLDEQRETIEIQRAEIDRLQRIMCRAERVGDDILDAEIIG